MRALRLFALPFLILTMLLGFISPAQAAPKQVLVLGDSITGGASNNIGFFMGANDGSVQTTFRTIGGTAPCDLLPGNGGPWTIQSLLAEKRYDAVVMAYSGNSMTRCMGPQGPGQPVVDKYRTDAGAIMRAANAAGVPRVVWVKPFAARDAGLDYVRTGVGNVYASLPASWPTARVIDGGIALENNGGWADVLPCAPWDPCGYGAVRIGDPDGVHLWCDSRPPSVYGVVQPCNNYSAAETRYGMNVAATRSHIGL